MSAAKGKGQTVITVIICIFAIAAIAIVAKKYIIPTLNHEESTSIEDYIGEGTDYPNLSTEKNDTYPIRCYAIKYNDDDITIYGKTENDCSNNGRKALENSIKK